MSAPTSNPTPKLNTSTLPLHLPSTKPLPHPTQAALTSALLSAHSIPRIEAQLSQSLAETGWTTNLRTYITNLVRSGECTSYKELLAKVMVAVREEGKEGGIGIPKSVVKEGLVVVRGEVEKVVDLRVDDVDD